VFEAALRPCWKREDTQGLRGKQGGHFLSWRSSLELMGLWRRM
jgi:hypothetical protein